MFNTNPFIQTRSTIHATEITTEALMLEAPSIFAIAPMAGASSRYSFLPTAQIVEAMRGNGWKPVSAQETNPRRIARIGFQRHEVRFQRRDQIAALDEFTPEVVILNSHDRSSGYQIHAGMYRFVCSNGLMVSDTLIPSVHVRHSGQEIGEIIQASFNILEQLPKMAERVSELKSHHLTDAAAQEFAKQALALRYSDPANAPIRAEQLLDARRNEDTHSNLWEVTNRVQENLLRGGMRDTSRVNRAGKPFRAMRGIRGLNANVRINLGIWTLAEAFRQN